MARRQKNIPDLEKFNKLLKDKGLKSTGPRLAVHRAMMKLEHASAEDVYDAILAEGIVRPSRASVYNILCQLAGKSIYSKLMSAGSKMYFDAAPDHHVHLHDIRNDVFVNIRDEDISATVREKLKKKRFKGYKVEYADIQIICRPTRTNKIKL